MDKFLWYFQEGGILMYPLAAISILSLAVIVERAIRLRRSRLFDMLLVEDVQKSIEAGQFSEASSKCEGRTTLAAKVLGAAIKEKVSTDVDMETALQESGQRELQVLGNNLSILSTIARVAPLLGLLGTVIGMIGAFEVLSEAGVGKEEMARNIRIALITTATGLIIAIPTVIADAYFRAKIRKIIALFEDIFIDMIKSAKIAVSGGVKESSPAPGADSGSDEGGGS
jgi:biopolymer transport protein ExbB